MKKILTIVCALIGITSYSQDTPELKVGGALRFNYNLSSWKKEQVKRGGDFGYDVFRININSAYKGITVDAEYRLYSQGSGGGILKQGWLGYQFDDKNSLEFGLTQVPFGLQPLASSSWFLNINYYLGLEDDFDMGIKWIYQGRHWQHQVAFFKNAEELTFGDKSPISPNRYSIDISGDNKEVNQINLKTTYYLDEAKQHHIGASLQYGGLYNIPTEKMGSHHAYALHYEGNYQNFSLKLQAVKASHQPAGADTKSIQMAAYAYPYEVAKDFTTYTIGLSKDFPVNFGPISNIQIYNDFGYMDKAEPSFEDSMQNTMGILITAGRVYTYIDFVRGRNQPWLDDSSIGFEKGISNVKWGSQVNINIGYYF